MAKRLRAIEMLRLLLAEKLTLGQLAKLNGLLEHLCDVFCLPRSAMFHMYEPMQASVVLHPDFEFVPSKHLVKQTAYWLLRLAKVAGSRCGQMLVTPWKATESTRLLHWYSDAAKEGCGRPGLGGWYSGYWWQWILPEGYGHLTIPLLEFIAVLVNIVVFGRLVLRGFHDMAFIVMHIDASASVTVLASGAPKSQPMQLVWEAISERPEYKKLKRRLGAAHTFGPANLMADAASRDKRDVISRISAQMRLEAVQLRVPSSLKETVYKIAQEIKLIMEDKAVKKSAVAAMSSEQLNHEVAAAVLVDQTAVDFDPQKLKEEKAAEWIADRITDKRAEWIADVDAHAGSVLPTVERPLTAAEQSLGLGQANTPDSASYVMQKKLTKMLELPPVYVAIEKIGYDLPTGNCTQAYNMGGFKKRSILRGDSVACVKLAKRAPVTPVTSFRIASEVHESKSTLNIYASEAVNGMTASLFNDKSPYALRLGDEPVMREAVSSLFALINDYVPSGTKSKDKSDWKWWEKMTARFGTRAWRDDALANLGYDRAGHFREIILQALVLVEVSKEMAPKEISRRQAGLKAKPGSAFSVLTSARRVHARFCVQMAKSPLVHLVLKSLLKRYIANHGLHALLPKRKEPFTRDMLVKMLSLEPPTGKGNSYGPCDDVHDFMVVLTLLTILAQTGMRLSELIGTEDECRPALCWDAFIYLLDDILIHSLDSEQAAKMRADCSVLFKVGTSKADPTGSHWAPFPVYLPFRWGEPINAAKAIMDLDQIVRVPDADRKRTAVFVKRSGKKMSRTYLVNTLDAMVAAVGKDPKQFSFHSARIWLACALKEAGASNSRTQGMVRWLSEDSLRIYARDSRHTYAHWLDKAMQADVDAKQVANLPTLDDDNAWSQLQDWIKLPDDDPNMIG
jgi:integrase